MKFRNKKTDEIKNFGNLQVYAETENTDERQLLGNFNSFKQILEYYEDYIPAEPLIKDKKIRKAVRAWAEANGVEQVTVEKDFSSYTFFAADTGKVDITVWTDPSLSNLVKDKTYTITELCGEEEE